MNYQVHPAEAGYATEIVADIATDGSIVYLASHPELDGCIAQGDTPEEAEENLADARDLYIRSLRERAIDVPEPRANPLKLTWQTTEHSTLRRRRIWREPGDHWMECHSR